MNEEYVITRNLKRLRFLINGIWKTLAETMKEQWENSISINPSDDRFEVIYSYELKEDIRKRVECGEISEMVGALIESDSRAIPITSDREGYHGDDHINYWLSGHTDLEVFQEQTLLSLQGETAEKSLLDLGCASGRFLRHLIHKKNSNLKILGCDINSRHISFLKKYMASGNATFFQNTSLPHLPIRDESIDYITAYSVFSHIDVLDTAWIMELHRVLRRGGVALITYHPIELLDLQNSHLPFYDSVSKHSDWKVISPFLTEKRFEKLSFRWRANLSYTANVFLSESYVNTAWSDILEVKRVIPSGHGYQSICILQKQ